ncbi:MAG: hypothetical protein LBH14_06980 [Desulfobulbaceae bacterium]|jgi:hypothetical protein|nr:hypothetical protein [Desulfobulbaceae bacterium]
MPSLKEQMAMDIPVFFNPREFGEEMLVDGVPCLGIWDEEKDQPVKQFFGPSFDNVMGVFTMERVLYAARRDGVMMAMPLPSQELDIDDKIWTVKDAVNDGGVIKLILYRNQS